MPKATIPNPKAIQSKMSSRRVLRLRSVLLVIELIGVDRSIALRDSARNPNTEPHFIVLRVWVMISPFTSTGWLPLPGRSPACRYPRRISCVRIRCTPRDERPCPGEAMSTPRRNRNRRYNGVPGEPALWDGSHSRCNKRHQHSSLSPSLMVIPMISPRRMPPSCPTI